ncbi:MAG: PUA domain-containing protein [Candidatus Hydrothermarchaeaceae archaeon]
MKFAPLGADERRALRELGNEFGVDIDEVLGDKTLLMALDGRREIYATIQEVVDVLDALGRNPYSVGLYIGEVKRGRFFLGLEGAYLFASHTDKKIVVDDNAEQLVLYGRDVFSKSVVDFSACGHGDRCLMVNTKGEPLGIGRVETGMVKNLMDRGWYLRKGE